MSRNIKPGRPVGDLNSDLFCVRPLGGAVTLRVTVTSPYVRLPLRTVEIPPAVDVVSIDLEPAAEY